MEKNFVCSKELSWRRIIKKTPGKKKTAGTPFSFLNKKPNSDDEHLPIANCPLTIFLTHGHQGDASSDGNWFSKFFVARMGAVAVIFKDKSKYTGIRFYKKNCTTRLCMTGRRANQFNLFDYGSYTPTGFRITHPSWTLI